mmetsp:Transcript_43910/g.131610  ORF Transcript_43910/g.131610 Transcript_43910/m.131610 type:complete len:275 (+) Transcript_43910:919-1743(+)
MSPLAVASCFPSGLKVSAVRPWLCPCSTATMRAVLPTPAGPVGGSAHSLATWSVEAVATKRPSGENCAAVTMLPVPLSDTMDSRWSPVAASHTFAVLSFDEVTMVAESGAHETVLTSLLWPTQMAAHVLAVRSHTRVVLSQLVVARNLPSGLNATQDSGCVCCVNVARHFPDRSQSFAVKSALAVASRSPSAEKQTALTACRWPDIVRIFCPDARSHRRAVQSRELVASCLPSGENAAPVTKKPAPLVPASVALHEPLARSHTLHALSRDVVAS